MKLFSLGLSVVLLFALGCTETLPTDVEQSQVVISDGSTFDVPAPVSKNSLIGTGISSFNPGLFADPVNNPSWYGTTTIDGTSYGSVWYSLGSDKPFGADNIRGNAFFAAEIWKMYTWIDFDPVTQELETGDLLLVGYAAGVQTVKQNVYRAHGKVLEAYGDFEMYLGRPLSERAVVEFGDAGLPETALGTVIVR